MPPQFRVTDADREKQAGEKRRRAQGLQLTGLVLLCVGLGAIRWWAGLIAFGIGLLLIGALAETE